MAHTTLNAFYCIHKNYGNDMKLMHWLNYDNVIKYSSEKLTVGLLLVDKVT